MAEIPLFKQMSDSKNPAYIQLGFGTSDLWSYHVNIDTGEQFLIQYINGELTGRELEVSEFGDEFEGGNGLKVKIPTFSEDGSESFTTVIYYANIDGIEGRNLGISEITTRL